MVHEGITILAVGGSCTWVVRISVARPLPSRRRRLTQPGMSPLQGLSIPRWPRLACLGAPCAALQGDPHPVRLLLDTVCGCGHSGTRENRTAGSAHP
jgi:hypothetical protein